MSEKNPWFSDSNLPEENSDSSAEVSNPWEENSEAENPWEVRPETTAFPPVGYSQPPQQTPSSWDESSEFGVNQQQSHTAQSSTPGHYPHSSVAAVPVPSPPVKRTKRWVVPLVIILALIALIAGGAVLANQAGYLTLSDSEDPEPVVVTEVVVVPNEEKDEPQGADDTSDSEEADAAAGEEDGTEVEDEAADSEEEEAARPTRVSLPDNAYAANTAARTGELDGNFNNVYTGSNATSGEFARQVRSAFADYYHQTGESSGTISAYSPVTGLTYSMSCVDNDRYVTCTGGNNAIVYIS